MTGSHDDQKHEAAAADPSRPLDAASVVVFDRSGHDIRILMGQRRGSQAFMPDRYVFPGGRMDPYDKSVTLADEGLAAGEEAKLLLEMKGHASAARARGLAVAGARELYEEAGLLLGRPIGAADPASGDAEPHPWPKFRAHGMAPSVAPLTYFARAITPPGRTRRFDTRFFCVPREHVALETDPLDDELLNVAWYSLVEIEVLNLAPITKVIVRDFLDRLDHGPLGPSDVPVPFYHQNHGTFRRDLLSPKTAALAPDEDLT